MLLELLYNCQKYMKSAKKAKKNVSHGQNLQFFTQIKNENNPSYGFL